MSLGKVKEEEQKLTNRTELMSETIIQKNLAEMKDLNLDIEKTQDPLRILS